MTAYKRVLKATVVLNMNPSQVIALILKDTHIKAFLPPGTAVEALIFHLSSVLGGSLAADTSPGQELGSSAQTSVVRDMKRFI